MSSLSPSDVKWFLEVNHLGIWKNLELSFLGKGQKMISRNSELHSEYFALGKYHLLPPGGGLLEFRGGHIIFGDKKGGTQNFFLLTGGTEDFHKKFLIFVFHVY